MRIEGLKIEKELDDGIEKPWDDLFLEQGGNLGFSWFMVSSGHQNLRKNNQLRSNTQRTSGWLWEDLQNLQSHDEF